MVCLVRAPEPPADGGTRRDGGARAGRSAWLPQKVLGIGHFRFGARLPGFPWPAGQGQPVWLVLEQRGEYVGCQGSPEVVALCDVAVEFLQSSGLLQGLDALGDHLFVERVA